MTTYFTIVQLGYEYNDEIMYQPESGGGQPVSLFKTRESANSHVDELNKKEIFNLISSDELSTYGYDWSDICDDESVIKILNLPDLYDFSNEDFDNLTADQKEVFLKNLNLNFYEVYEVKLED